MDFGTRPEESTDAAPSNAPAEVGAPAFPDAAPPPNVSFVVDDGGWDTWAWSQLPGAAPRGPKDLGEMADSIDAQVGEDGQIGDFNLIGHGVPGSMETGEKIIGNPQSGHPHDENEDLRRIADHMPEDKEIVMGGCNFAEGQEGAQALLDIARDTDQRASGGISLQLPLPGIEGTKYTAVPGVDGGAPTLEKRSTWFDQMYDGASNIVEAGLGLAATKEEKLERALAPDVGPVLPPIELPAAAPAPDTHDAFDTTDTGVQ
jgi:hypothetical protein